MNPPSSLILWINFQEKRYFLVPAVQTLPAGDMLLISPVGRSQQVDPESLKAWEIPEAVALAFLQSGTTQLLDNWQERLQQWQTAFATPPDASAAPTALSGETLFIAGLLGIDPEELQRDPQAFMASLKHLALELADFMADSISGEADRAIVARQRLQQLTAHLPPLSHEITTGLETLPEKLQIWYASSPDPEKFEQFMAVLRTFGTEASPPVTAADDLQQTLARLMQNLTALFTQNAEEEQRAHYQALAHEAVESAVGEIPQFDFKKVWAAYQQRKSHTEPSSSE